MRGDRAPITGEAEVSERRFDGRVAVITGSGRGLGREYALLEGIDCFTADGRVRDVIYLGLYTRYLVELEGGGDLVVVEQNLKTTSMDVTKVKGQKVCLCWRKEHVSYVGG